MRYGILLLAAAAVMNADIERPLIGNIRDLAGDLRPVYGVAGAFVLGDVITDDGERAKAASNRETAQAETEGSLEGDEILIRRTGVRLRAPAGVSDIEVMGKGWLLLRTPSRLYAVRTDAGREDIFVLPEADK